MYIKQKHTVYTGNVHQRALESPTSYRVTTRAEKAGKIAVLRNWAGKAGKYMPFLNKRLEKLEF